MELSIKHAFDSGRAWIVEARGQQHVRWLAQRRCCSWEPVINVQTHRINESNNVELCLLKVIISRLNRPITKRSKPPNHANVAQHS